MVVEYGGVYWWAALKLLEKGTAKGKESWIQWQVKVSLMSL